jgi:hypothetical protein
VSGTFSFHNVITGESQYDGYKKGSTQKSSSEEGRTEGGSTEGGSQEGGTEGSS